MTRPNFGLLPPDDELMATMVDKRDGDDYIRAPFEVTSDELIEFATKACLALDAFRMEEKMPLTSENLQIIKSRITKIWLRIMWSGLMADYQQASDEIERESEETPTGTPHN